MVALVDIVILLVDKDCVLVEGDILSKIVFGIVYFSAKIIEAC